MTEPTYDQTLHLLKKWEAQHEALQSLQTRVFSTFGGNPEGIFFNTIWTTFDEYTHALARLIKCTQSHPKIASDLHWHWHENNMGRSRLRCRKEHKTYQIDNIEMLALFIWENRQ